jgi:hypothetical protein
LLEWLPTQKGFTVEWRCTSTIATQAMMMTSALGLVLSKTLTVGSFHVAVIAASKMPDIDDVGTYDQYVGAQVGVSIGDDIWSGKVVRRKRELDGTVKG